jgi:nicotinate-nucleotide--dimethylbenzimidazole phosphoribosyltransferase
MICDAGQLERRVRARLDNLTKPAGSLGALEEIALRFALIKGEEMPSCARKAIYIFCGDHGVTSEGISAFPSEVTQQMMRNFVDGGAAISVLARRLEAIPAIVDAGCYGPPVKGVLNRKIAPGTKNFALEPAMTREQATSALVIGSELAEQAAGRYDLVGLGEMGIGNTTTAATIVCAISGWDPAEVVGPGAGLGAGGLERKIAVVRRALKLHAIDPADGLGVLAAVGGFEIGAIAGFLMRASELQLPVVIDGFPCTAGALIAQVISRDSLNTAFFSHVSAEPGHRRTIARIGGRPWFDLGLRLGEGTGAAVMMGLIDMAVRLYREMATFREAGVASGVHADADLSNVR